MTGEESTSEGGSGPELLSARRGAVLELTINRPAKGNSLTPNLILGLNAGLRDASEDPEIRVVVLTGQGSRFFCTGTDLSGAPPTSPVEDQLGAGGSTRHPAASAEWGVPVIAAINGFALGGGLELALACDLRIASTAAVFGLPESGLGSIPGAGGTQRLPRQIPQAVAAKMLLTGERMGADEALRWGLVSDVVEPEALIPRAWELAEKVAGNAPLAIAAIRQARSRGAALPLGDAMALERSLFNLLKTTQDWAEGRSAFRERRPPRFIGK